MPTAPRAATAVSTSVATTGLLLASALLVPPIAQAADDDSGPTFTRLNVDTHITGASFTTVGEVFDGEQNIVTSGFGSLGMYGMPAGGGTVQVYRPKANASDWRKVTVFDASEGIIFPNRPTVADVNGDGRNDVIVPSGYFFDTNPDLPTGPQERGAITWWENAGTDGSGNPLPFVRHDVITGQPGSYHGVEHVDLDGDGTLDLVSTAEQGRVPSNTADDIIELQFFKGLGDGEFAAPVTLSDHGGSLPVVHDVDGDGRLDIITAQYFDTAPIPGPESSANPTFLWLEQVGDADGPLTSANFVPHTIATLAQTAAGRGVGMGFQIRPVEGFREPGKVSWVGTNHQNRCAQPYLPPEEVIEFLPGDDIRAQWGLRTLSVPESPSATPVACDADFKAGLTLFHPGGEITSRATQGQGAPGVFGYGDVDGDGDIDLVVSGDGDRRLFWIEQLADGATVMHTLTDPGEEFGQAGGAEVADLDGDGTNELVFSSFDRNALAIWKRTGGGGPQEPPTEPVVTKRSKLTLTPRPVTVRKNGKATVRINLTAAAGGPARSVVVRWVPNKGKAKKLGTQRLNRINATKHRGKVTWRPKKPGRLVVRYAGTRVSPTLKDTAVTQRVKVRMR
jgi:hypothetical protein